tara:strand:+ start:155417 stop:155932 length:516 start_codon:yes stop_codon:yes gene_type:complete
MVTNSNAPKGQGEELKQMARDVATETMNTGARVADTVASEASNYANQAKDTAADEVKDVASALRAAASDLRRGSPQERTFSQIADGLADASEAVRGKDLSEIMGDLNGFAKRNPLVFLGSAALIGFAATRFAKASGEATSSRDGSPSEYAMDRPAPADRPASPHVVTGERS